MTRTQKDDKKVKKGVDKGRGGVYNTSSRREQGKQKALERDDMILENDTESRRTRTRFFEVVSKEDSQFENEF